VNEIYARNFLAAQMAKQERWGKFFNKIHLGRSRKWKDIFVSLL